MAMMLKEVMSRLPVSCLAVHCHDTHRRALDNIKVALQVWYVRVSYRFCFAGGTQNSKHPCRGSVSPEISALRLNVVGFGSLAD